MQTEHLISTTELCAHYNVELSFISALGEYGLLEIISTEENGFIDANELRKLEQYTRLHYDLDVNFEGIEAINHLLQRIRNMQEEIINLKNRLRLYESK